MRSAAINAGAEITIERVGHLGDGIALGPEGLVHIPFAAPGDVYKRDVSTPSGWVLAREGDERAAPPCPHYGSCGGCNLQHLARATYLRSKHEWVIAALANQNIETTVDPIVEIAPRTRRRVTFTARGSREGLAIGFTQRQSHDLVTVTECPVALPAIVSALDPLRPILVSRLRSRGDAQLMVTETLFGLDVAVSSKIPAKAVDHAEIDALRTARIIRLSWNGEILFAAAPVRLDLSGVAVDLPTSAFLQAARESEAVMVRRVQEALAGSKRVADFYAGVGTFAFALAKSAAVDVFEGSEESVAAIVNAAKRASGLKAVRAERRDLARRPLMTADLKPYDGVVLDPPRTGAEAQARQLAPSKVQRIAYVSCFPASFASDARVLISGGFKLMRVTPIDQFLWSHHVELVGVFER